MADAHIRALTARRPIKPTSPRCPSAWQPKPGRRPTYRRGKSVQKTGTTSEAIRTRGFEVTYRPNAQFQNDKGIIYHPKGYLPFVFSDGASPEVVFSDDAFQDQLISAATGRTFIFLIICSEIRAC